MSGVQPAAPPAAQGSAVPGLRWLDRAIEALLGAALLGLVAIGAAQIFCRFVLGRPLSWVLEASILGLVWATMLSGYLGVRRDTHLSADFLGWSGGERMRWGRDLVGLLLCLGFTATYGIVSWPVIDAMSGIGFTSIPVGQPVLYWSLPVSAALMALAFLDRLLRHFARRPGAPA